MKPIHKKRSLYGGTVLLLILLVGWIWNSWFSTTRIAFINYQVINLGEFIHPDQRTEYGKSGSPG